jgi:hypothetical protein
MAKSLTSSINWITLLGICSLVGLGFTACSGKKTHENGPVRVHLAKLEGKKIALVDVTGPDTARSVVEVALINQLAARGTFILVSKQDVDAARKAFDQDPTDLVGLAKRAGADFALQANVIQFDADTHVGYSEQEVEDSQLKEETGNGKTQQVYKVQQMDGHVAVELFFTDVNSREVSSGVAEASGRATSEAKTEAAHLPPKLRFLEKISNDAFHKFFEIFN